MSDSDRLERLVSYSLPRDKVARDLPLSLVSTQFSQSAHRLSFYRITTLLKANY